MNGQYLDYSTSPEDMEAEVQERSSAIGASRDAAYEAGAESFENGDVEAARDALAALWGHPKLVADFCDGYATAAMQTQS